MTCRSTTLLAESHRTIPDDEQQAPSAVDPNDVDDLRSLDILAKRGHSPGILFDLDKGDLCKISCS